MDKIEMAQRVAELRQVYQHDFTRFASDCLKIRTKVDGIQPFVLNEAQMDFVQRYERQMATTGKARFIILKARQMGISTLIEALAYWYTTRNKGVKTLVLTHLDQQTQELFEITKRYHDNCWDAFKPKATRDSTSLMNFSGIDSAFRTATSGSRNAGHGSTVQILHWSEVSRSRNQEDMIAGVLQAIPNGKGTMIFLESTANGFGDYFHETWEAAVRGENEYEPVFYPWFMMKEYVVDPTGKEFTQEEREYQELYGLTDEQLAWRQSKIKSFKGSEARRVALFREQYPATPLEAFQSANESFIEAKDVLAARHRDDVEAVGPVIGACDPARKGKDHTAIVIRQGRKVLKIVRTKIDDTMVIAQRCAELIDMYGLDAFMVDVVGLGAGVYDRLVQMGYGSICHEAVASAQADKPEAFYNKRAEMWWRMAEWLQDEVSIPDSDVVQGDLMMLSYQYDSRDRFKLQSKSGMKRSPDIADAIAMTFYLQNIRGRGAMTGQQVTKSRLNSGSVINVRV
nr:MAG TPA: Terminase large subunit [Bacteriophage sp.]